MANVIMCIPLCYQVTFLGIKPRDFGKEVCLELITVPPLLFVDSAEGRSVQVYPVTDR
uniref:Uncharacterized protein n=1 Tax=Arundo donax TaxID=35708 RepID=A0A0A9EY64_ARUDO